MLLRFKDIDMEEIPTANKYYLEINGANSSATVFMNGNKLASHDGGYSTWRVDITEELGKGNKLAILVDNSANETVYPQMADFTFYGGLYRNVNIIAVRSEDKDKEEIKTLVEVLHSKEIQDFINETYKGSVIPSNK